MDQSRAHAAVPGQQGRTPPAVPSPSRPEAADADGSQDSTVARGSSGSSAAPDLSGASAVLPREREGEPARGEHVHSEPAPPRVPQRHSVRAQVLVALREALLSGKLRPGEVYSAPALAARFGVSPTPVREAMQQLVSEGSVTTVPNRGFRVAERTQRELAEVAEVRALLEIPAVMAIARAQPAECWQALRPLADEVFNCAMRGDLTGFAAADQAFHRALLELGGNWQLTQLAEELCRRAQRQAAGAAELRSRAGHHGELLEALSAGDLVRAEAVLREQLAP